jgi:uncharacterized protein YlxW (UPF0749 family)
MTDQREPEDRTPTDRTPTPADRGLPTAGRKPAGHDPEPAAGHDPDLGAGHDLSAGHDSDLGGGHDLGTGHDPDQAARHEPDSTAGDGDEPTVITPPEPPADLADADADGDADEPPAPGGADDEDTTRLTPPPEAGPPAGGWPPAADDEPTVEARTPAPPPSWPVASSVGETPQSRAGRADPGGDTVRLKQPAVVPGATTPAPATAGERAGVDTEADADERAGTDDESPDVVIASEAAATQAAGDSVPVPEKGVDRPAAWRRLSSAGALIWVLLALFGFTLVVQLRSNNADEGLATARQEDLVRILSDLEARDQRLQAEINTLEQSQRSLTSGVAGRQAALAEADKRADELGLLAGTLPGRGPGLSVVIDPKDKVKASAVLNAVQELRGAGGEVMQITGANSAAVRIVASTYFVDAEGGGIVVDDKRLTGPYTLWVIGVPQTMQTALQIPGGVVASVNSAGGSVTMEPRTMVEVTAVRKATSLQYARPVS